jgi:hypothetical protein
MHDEVIVAGKSLCLEHLDAPVDLVNSEQVVIERLPRAGPPDAERHACRVFTRSLGRAGTSPGATITLSTLAATSARCSPNPVGPPFWQTRTPDQARTSPSSCSWS